MEQQPIEVEIFRSISGEESESTFTLDFGEDFFTRNLVEGGIITQFSLSVTYIHEK